MTVKWCNVNNCRQYPQTDRHNQGNPGIHEILVTMRLDNKMKPIKRYGSNCHCQSHAIKPYNEAVKVQVALFSSTVLPRIYSPAPIEIEDNNMYITVMIFASKKDVKNTVDDCFQDFCW